MSTAPEPRPLAERMRPATLEDMSPFPEAWKSKFVTNWPSCAGAIGKLDPAGDDVHLWVCELNDINDWDRIAAETNLLSKAERQRLARFKDTTAWQLGLLSQVMRRHVLAAYLPSYSPAAWRFATNGHGKPHITAPPAGTGWQFNLSHTHERIVLGISRQHVLGVDTETPTRQTDWLEIARRFFHPDEFRYMATLDAAQQQHWFFQAWTLKEAYLKACGVGLAGGLDRLQIREIALQAIDYTMADEGTPWWLGLIDWRQDRPIAVCCQTQPNALRLYRLRPFADVTLCGHSLRCRSTPPDFFQLEQPG